MVRKLVDTYGVTSAEEFDCKMVYSTARNVVRPKIKPTTVVRKELQFLIGPDADVRRNAGWWEGDDWWTMHLRNGVVLLIPKDMLDSLEFQAAAFAAKSEVKKRRKHAKSAGNRGRGARSGSGRGVSSR